MRKINAYTFVICPVGTYIELYTDFKPSIGRKFDILHIDTKEVVQRAVVSKTEETEFSSKKMRQIRVTAKIIK